MMHVSNSLGSAGKAMLLAGPIFLASILAASLYQMLPEPIPVGVENIAQMFVVALISVPIGAFLACFPVLFGAIALSMLGKHSSLFRKPIVWTISGLLIGLAMITAQGGLEASMTFALLVTCAVCARAARIGVTWSAADQSSANALTPAVAISACPPK
jgi:hypothetical protein